MFNKAPFSKFVSLILFGVVMFSTTMSTAQQQSKPQLVEIVLNEENTNPDAEKIIEKIYNNWIKENNTGQKIGEIRAVFLPIAKDGSESKFIYGILYGEDFGGCYNRGCRTVVFHSPKGDNKWIGVFNAFVHNAFYDVNSRETRNANLIFSSNLDNSNPGIWMWNGTGYELVNKR